MDKETAIALTGLQAPIVEPPKEELRVRYRIDHLARLREVSEASGFSVQEILQKLLADWCAQIELKLNPPPPPPAPAESAKRGRKKKPAAEAPAAQPEVGSGQDGHVPPEQHEGHQG